MWWDSTNFIADAAEILWISTGNQQQQQQQQPSECGNSDRDNMFAKVIRGGRMEEHL
jgi:hypothetical protein